MQADRKKIQTNKINILMNLFNSSKKNLSKDYINAIHREKLNQLQGEGFSIWATDASVNDTSTGCAACNISCKQNFLFRIPNRVSSLTGELHAIDKAIDIILEDGFSKIAIFTDSKNACCLLQKNTSHNYIVNNILTKIENSEIHQLTVIWTPSHTGISPNELADHYAKHASDAGCIIPSNFSYRDAHNEIHQALWNEWVEKYKDVSTHKGTYFYQFFPTPPKQHWYKGLVNSARNIKIINRLFAGHTYCKNYLYQIGIETTNLCDKCNAVEDEKHLIFHCNIYKDERKKYKIFTKYTNLPQLLNNHNKNDIDELLSFIDLCKINL